MEPIGHARLVEQSHLLFLAPLSRRVGQRAIVVKDGCNLRFFFRSIRCPEDMDLDAGPIDRQLLRDRVREVLGSRPFGQVLAYLPPEEQARFDSSSVWDSMVLEVVDALGRERP